MNKIVICAQTTKNEYGSNKTKVTQHMFLALYVFSRLKVKKKDNFHSTLDSPIQLGTVIRAYGPENLRDFFSRFYFGSRYQIDTKSVCL